MELIKVEGMTGSSGWIDADDVRTILPAAQGGKDGEIPVLGACVIQFKTPTAPGMVIKESVDSFAERVNAARRGSTSRLV